MRSTASCMFWLGSGQALGSFPPANLHGSSESRKKRSVFQGQTTCQPCTCSSHLDTSPRVDRKCATGEENEIKVVLPVRTFSRIHPHIFVPWDFLAAMPSKASRTRLKRYWWKQTFSWRVLLCLTLIISTVLHVHCCTLAFCQYRFIRFHKHHAPTSRSHWILSIKEQPWSTCAAFNSSQPTVDIKSRVTGTIVSSNVQQRFRTYWSAYKTAPWVSQRSGGKSVSSISSILVSALVCDKENTHTICIYIYLSLSLRVLWSYVSMQRLHTHVEL